LLKKVKNADLFIKGQYFFWSKNYVCWVCFQQSSIKKGKCMKKILSILSISFFVSTQCMHVKVGSFSHKGRKDAQEDRYDMVKLGDEIGIGVFDGHGGKQVSKYLERSFFYNVGYFLQKKTVRKALEEAIDFCENYTKDKKDNVPMASAGATLLATWFDPATGKGHVVSVGDSVAILVGKNNKISMAPIHRPTDENEKQRIINAGGKISNDGRVEGMIAVSRSIGDKIFKEKKPNLVISTPDYHEYDAIGHDYLILATDGFYDALKSTGDDELRYIDFLKIFLHVFDLSDEKFNKKYPLPSDLTMKSEEESSSEETNSSEDENSGDIDLEDVSQDANMRSVAKRLVQVALSRGGIDNTTVVVMKLLNDDASNASAFASVPFQDLIDGLQGLDLTEFEKNSDYNADETTSTDKENYDDTSKNIETTEAQITTSMFQTTITTTTITTEDKKEKVAEEEKKEDTEEKDKKEEITEDKIEETIEKDKIEDKKEKIVEVAEKKESFFPAILHACVAYKNHIFGTCTGIILIAFIMHYYKHTPLTCIGKMTLIEKISETLWKLAGVGLMINS
jgi:serine/threonine protein phosphatase PrpC